MSMPLLEQNGSVELEGTVEEIQQLLCHADFAGQHLHVTVQALQSPDMPPDGPENPLNAALEAIWTQVPDSSWERFPADFGDNSDHYLHGTPKQK